MKYLFSLLCVLFLANVATADTFLVPRPFRPWIHDVVTTGPVVRVAPTMVVPSTTYQYVPSTTYQVVPQQTYQYVVPQQVPTYTYTVPQYQYRYVAPTYVVPRVAPVVPRTVVVPNTVVVPATPVDAAPAPCLPADAQALPPPPVPTR